MIYSTLMSMKKSAQSRTAPTTKTKQQAIVAFPKELTTVTPLTKVFAFIVVIGSVVLAFTLGRLYEIVKTI